MKKIPFLLLLLVQQAHATIVNYTCLVPPDSKRKIHLFADVHVDSPRSAKQVNDELISFLLKKRDAVFYIDGYKKNDYKTGPEHYHKAITYLASKNLLDIGNFLDRPYRPEDFEFVYKLLTFHEADINNLQEQIKLIQQFSYSSLSELQRILLENNIHIKDDNRPNEEEKRCALSEFDDAMINDCLYANNDVIIFAGIAHIDNLEKVLRSYGYYTTLSLKDTSKLTHSIFGNYSVIEAVCRQEFIKAYHTGVFQNMDAFNDYFTHITDFGYNLKIRDFAINPDLLNAAINSAIELSDMKIYRDEPLFEIC